MLPIRLELHNFLAYRAPDSVRFEGVHLACLTGSNGAGKSSLLDAITWVLWGKARARRDEELIHLGQHDMYVQLDFEQEGIVYRVLRQRTRKSGGTGALEFFSLGEDGQLIPLTEPSIRQTQARINRLLRLDYETFIHSAFLQQGRADAFTVKTPRERKQILSDILGLARWETYEQAAKDILKEIDTELASHEAVLTHIDQELRREPHLRAELEAAQAAHVEAQASLAAIAHVETDLRHARAQQLEIETRLRDRARELDRVQNEIARQRERIADYQATIARRDEIEAGYQALQTARESDSLLGGLLLQLQELETEQHTLERALDAARAEIERELSACDAEIASLERTIASAQPEALTEVQTEIGSLQALESQRDRLQDDLLMLEREQAELKATNAALKDEMNELRDRLDRLEHVSGAVCPLCGQPLDDAHRFELIAQLTAEGKQRGDTYRSNQARMAELKAQNAEHKASLATMSAELQRLTPLVERAGVLQAGVDAASHAQAQLDAVQTRAAGLRQQLERGDYAPDLRAQIEDNRARRAALGYDKGQHTSVRRDLQTYRAFEAERTALEIALKALPDLEAALAGALASCARLEQVIAEENAQLQMSAIEIARLEVLVQELRAREDEMRKQHALERSAFNRVNAAIQQLDILETQRARRVEIEARQRQRREDRAVYEALRDAFSKKGIPAMIIDAAIPELESEANRLLMRMTDGRMQIKLETQREKVTGGVAETLDIHIADELGTRSYELYSGGEAFRINFALRVALSQLLARRAGAHLRTLFIDEGFGTQDEEGRSKLVEAITAIQDDFDMILVVTHIDELRDSFPVHLQVQKTREGSFISLR